MWVISQFRHGIGPFDARLGINVGPAQNGGTLVVAWSRLHAKHYSKIDVAKLCPPFATLCTVHHLSQNVGLVQQRHQVEAQKQTSVPVTPQHRPDGSREGVPTTIVRQLPCVSPRFASMDISLLFCHLEVSRLVWVFDSFGLNTFLSFESFAIGISLIAH